MNLGSIIEEYLNDFKKELSHAKKSGQFTPELSFRPLLDRFFRSISSQINKNICIVFEPRNQHNSGHPDWRFHNSSTLALYGYVEAKPLDVNNPIPVGDYKEQIEKYKKLGSQVILTDGIDFVFYSPKLASPQKVSLVSKPVNWKDPKINLLIEKHFNEFFQYEGFMKCSEVRLVEEVAKRCVELSKVIEGFSSLPIGCGVDKRENRTIKTLYSLKAIIEKHHDATLKTSKEFADFISQVLMFGLLYAHRVIRDENLTSKQLYDGIHKFWNDMIYKDRTRDLRPFRALIDMLGAELESIGPVGIWYDDCRLMLAHIQLDDKQKKTPDYHLLFEHFLSVFDPKKRFDFGAFYTPPELAKYSVRLTREIIEKELPGVEFYDPNNKFIDPCCGTGNFIEQLIENSDSRVPLPRLIGFEILPAPYALAHYRLSMLRAQKNLSIILTDTLSDELEKGIRKPSGNLWEAELNAARNLAKPPLTLIIGNPPSSDALISANKTDKIIENLLEDFRPPKDKRKTRQNIQKQLNNQFVRFLRWACNKLLSSKIGVLALVIPSSFAEHGSYVYARKWLTENFHKLWFLDIDSDARTGTPSSNLFKTLQGRSLLIGVIDAESKSKCELVNYGSLTHLSSANKMKFLTATRAPKECLNIFSSVLINKQTYGFRGLTQTARTDYNNFWKLYSDDNEKNSIFLRHCSGLKLAPTSLFVHTNKNALIRRNRDIADERNSVQDIQAKWFSGQDKPPSASKFDSSIRKEIDKAVKDTSVPLVRYAYRPMINLWALISEEVLSKLANFGGGGTRYRPEILKAFENKDVFGFVVAPAPKDIGETLHRFVSFCWHIPDNDLCKRGNAHIFCNKFPQYKTKRDGWDSKPITNVNSALIDKLKALLNKSDNEIADLIIFYIYGILSSNSYLEEFKASLFKVAASSDAPRIPIIKYNKLFLDVSDYGRRLAEIEKVDHKIEFPKTYESLISAFTKPFFMTSYKVDAKAGTIYLCEERQVKIKLDKLSPKILDMQISGYNVVQQWLKIYSNRYSRIPFSNEEYLEFLSLLVRIDLQTQLLKELDVKIKKIISEPSNLL